MDILFALSVAATHAATNIDNLAVLLVLAATAGIGRPVSAYAISQGLALAAAALVGGGAAEIAAQWVHLLGLVPLGLGLVGLWRLRRDETPGATPKPQPGSFAAMIAGFLALSTDSFAVMTAIYADSAAAFDLSATAGALASIALTSAIACAISRAASGAGPLPRRLEIAGPLAMIAAGIYVLMNTPTDIM